MHTLIRGAAAALLVVTAMVRAEAVVDPFAMPVHAAKLARFDSVGAAMTGLLAPLDYTVAREALPADASAVLKRPVPAYLAHDEIVVLRELLTALAGPTHGIAIDTAQRQVRIAPIATVAASAPPAIPEPRGRTARSTRYEVAVEAGSLKTNLMQILEDFGYTLGRWEFGNATEEYDWDIPKSYRYDAPRDLEKVLISLSRHYHLRARINELDKTVDFQTALGGAQGGSYAQ